jgi:hypothetical protein
MSYTRTPTPHGCKHILKFTSKTKSSHLSWRNFLLTKLGILATVRARLPLGTFSGKNKLLLLVYRKKLCSVHILLTIKGTEA